MSGINSDLPISLRPSPCIKWEIYRNAKAKILESMKIIRYSVSMPATSNPQVFQGHEDTLITLFASTTRQ